MTPQEGLHRGAINLRLGHEPVVPSPTERRLLRDYGFLYEGQAVGNRPIPWPNDDFAFKLVVAVMAGIRSNRYDAVCDLGRALQQSVGIDWPTVNSVAVAEFMRGNVAAAKSIWEWLVDDLRANRDPEDRGDRYVELQEPFTEREWSQLLSYPLVNLADLAWQEQAFGEAVRLGREAVAATTDPKAKIPRLLKLATYHWDAGETDAALGCARQASDDSKSTFEAQVESLLDTHPSLAKVMSEVRSHPENP